MHNRLAPELRKNRDSLQTCLQPGRRPRAFLSFHLPVAFALAMAGLAGHARALEPPAGTESVSSAPRTAQDRAIWPRMGLEEALEAFEKNYRAPNSAGRFHELNMAGSQNLVEDLSVLNDKIRVSAKHSQEHISLRPYILPVPLPAQKLKLWKTSLPSGISPPAVSHHTFVVTLNGKAYVIAPAHGIRGDKRYYTPTKSDTAVRLATEAEARHAISLDTRPSELPGKIVTLEGKLLTGESIRFESAAVRGLEPLRVLLPDVRMSFHNWKRGVEVDYERMQIFILPPEWSYPNRLRIHRAAGFSGAPAIERTPQGDAVIGHFIGHRAIKVGGKKITLGIVEDHHAIRLAVEMFAARSGKEANLNPPERPRP